MFTMLLAGALGGDSERAGFRWVALDVYKRQGYYRQPGQCPHREP